MSSIILSLTVLLCGTVGLLALLALLYGLTGRGRHARRAGWQ
jgi:hypothetical protein